MVGMLGGQWTRDPGNLQWLPAASCSAACVTIHQHLFAVFSGWQLAYSILISYTTWFQFWSVINLTKLGKGLFHVIWTSQIFCCDVTLWRYLECWFIGLLLLQNYEWRAFPICPIPTISRFLTKIHCATLGQLILVPKSRTQLQANAWKLGAHRNANGLCLSMGERPSRQKWTDNPLIFCMAMNRSIWVVNLYSIRNKSQNTIIAWGG